MLGKGTAGFRSVGGSAFSSGDEDAATPSWRRDCAPAAPQSAHSGAELASWTSVSARFFQHVAAPIVLPSGELRVLYGSGSTCCRCLEQVLLFCYAQTLRIMPNKGSRDKS